MRTHLPQSLCIAALALSSMAGGDGGHGRVQTKTALAKAKITILRAVETARKRVGDGRLIEAELKMRGDTPTFDVEFLTGMTTKEVKINAVSGKVLEVETEQIAEKRKAKAAAYEKALAKAKITLSQAIAIGQKKVAGGKAYAGEFELEDGRLTCEVKLVAGRKFIEVTIDPATGKVLRVEQQRAATVWNFDKNPPDQVPSGWSIRQTRPTKSLATWRVVADATAPSKPNVLALTRTENYDGTFNLAIAEQTSFKDLDLTVKVEAVSGKEDQGGGPIWRCKDRNNYYICRFNPLEGNYRVYRVKDGRRKQLQSIKVVTVPEKWYTVRVTMIGERITCYLDGKKLLETEDETFKDAGMVGLWTKADAATRFDDLRVRGVKAKHHRETKDREDKKDRDDENDKT